jgi:hypothetical protein
VSVEAEEEVEGDAVPSDLSRLSQIKFAQELRALEVMTYCLTEPRVVLVEALVCGMMR